MKTTLTTSDNPRLLKSWLGRNQPHTEKRGDRLAICTQGLQLVEVCKLYDLIDYRVQAVCGPYTELLPNLNPLAA